MRKRLLDRLLLVVGALIATAVLVGSVALGRKYHIRWEWNNAAGMGLAFVWMLGQRLRSKRREPFVIPFFAICIATHTLGTIMIVERFPILLLALYTALELGVAITVASRLFGIT
jgi:hypothetical protein